MKTVARRVRPARHTHTHTYNTPMRSARPTTTERLCVGSMEAPCAREPCACHEYGMSRVRYLMLKLASC
jgi:hypothetical protein